MCSFISYETEAIAYRAAQGKIDVTPKQKGVTYGDEWYRVFPCEVCHGWHYGSGSRLPIRLDTRKEPRRQVNMRDKK